MIAIYTIELSFNVDSLAQLVFRDEKEVNLVWALVSWAPPGVKFIVAVKEGTGCS
jgi:hypothetical protein